MKNDHGWCPAAVRVDGSGNGHSKILFLTRISCTGRTKVSVGRATGAWPPVRSTRTTCILWPKD